MYAACTGCKMHLQPWEKTEAKMLQASLKRSWDPDNLLEAALTFPLFKSLLNTFLFAHWIFGSKVILTAVNLCFCTLKLSLKINIHLHEKWLFGTGFFKDATATAASYDFGRLQARAIQEFNRCHIRWHLATLPRQIHRQATRITIGCLCTSWHTSLKLFPYS